MGPKRKLRSQAANRLRGQGRVHTSLRLILVDNFRIEYAMNTVVV